MYYKIIKNRTTKGIGKNMIAYNMTSRIKFFTKSLEDIKTDIIYEIKTAEKFYGYFATKEVAEKDCHYLKESSTGKAYTVLYGKDCITINEIKKEDIPADTLIIVK